ncbi:hypothetical protein KP509_19G012600 [Ceratopteris richardii]|uniref:F-box domain-containing protein n=1 Tax=Ceratopteris richardii TaxID=49495 RepID=A0A8T2SJT6_CERRI|nr:hypothetical protein KP509_19G012600 [Ceratopteris richardii]
MGHGASNMSCVSVQAEEEEEEDLDDYPELALQTTSKMGLSPRHVVQEDFTTLLPDECLSIVFQKLGTNDRNRCSLVCKRWYSVEAQARQRLALMAHGDIASYLPSIFSRFDHISKLILRGDRKVVGISNKSLFLIGHYCTHLRKLKIKGCKQITDEGIDLFARVCGSNLRKLSCGSCNFGARAVNSIIKHCCELEDLTLKRLRGLADGPADFIGPGYGTIRRLCLKELVKAQLFGPLIAGSINLHTLMLCRNPGNWDKLLDIITEHIPGLVELHMEKIQISDRALHAISRCTRLESLYVVRAPDCTSNGLSAIAEGCRRLRKLHVDGWSRNLTGDEGLASLSIKCRELQEVVLVGVTVTAASLDLMASNCLNLERLAICNSDTVADVELLCIFAKCHALKKLCIKGCAISDEGMKGLAHGCPQLTKMKVKKCRGITWQSAAWLRRHRPLLALSLDCETPEIPNTSEVAEEIDMNEDALISISISLTSRSPLATMKSALVAGGNFVACSLRRWASFRGP